MQTESRYSETTSNKVVEKVHRITNIWPCTFVPQTPIHLNGYHLIRKLDIYLLCIGKKKKSQKYVCVVEKNVHEIGFVVLFTLFIFIHDSQYTKCICIRLLWTQLFSCAIFRPKFDWVLRQLLKIIGRTREQESLSDKWSKVRFSRRWFQKCPKIKMKIQTEFRIFEKSEHISTV